MGTNAFSTTSKSPVLTILTSSIGRCLDAATAIPNEDGSVLLLSSQQDGQLAQYLDRYIFPADDIFIESTVRQGVDIMGMSATEAQERGLHALPALYGSIVLGEPQDFTRYVDDEEWEKKRIWNGIPAVGSELTKDYNPLEAGLWQYVSFEKGCYIGQETIARLNTYDGVKQYLSLLKLESSVQVGTKLDPLPGEERSQGVITSVCEIDGEWRALAYIRKSSGGVGEKVSMSGTSASVLEAPYLTFGYDQRSKLVM